MTSLKKETFACVDLELTGLSVENDHIIEVAVAIFTFDEIKQNFETLIDPGVPIPQESIAIHNITDDMVRGKPKITSVLPQVFALLKNHVVIGHGVSFDLAVLAQAALRARIDWQFPKEYIIDTLRLARLYGESPTNSLEALRQHFHISNEGAHRAMNDVIVNIQVFKRLTTQFRSLKDLFQRLQRPIAMKTMPLGKHKGRPFSDIPFDYLRWASQQNFDEDLLFSLNTELKKRRKKLGFQQNCRPFENLDFS